jgi:hypothetical protein
MNVCVVAHVARRTSVGMQYFSIFLQYLANRNNAPKQCVLTETWQRSDPVDAPSIPGQSHLTSKAFARFGGTLFGGAGAAARQELSQKSQGKIRQHLQRRSRFGAAHDGNRGPQVSFVTLACPSFSSVRNPLFASSNGSTK